MQPQMEGVSRRGLRRRREWLVGSVLWKQRAEMSEGEAGEDKSQPRVRRPCRICAVEATGGDEARAVARADEGYGSDRWRLGVLNLGLYLTALGTGGLKSSVFGFGSDQFDEIDGVLRNSGAARVLEPVGREMDCKQ
ncbi:hypothetical protein B296_00002605 [Ensete ventricosum]|uniref:Uncharacterized protein n=1 Tax=Ensete ventricosum TaxID=4639 RepID=A0A426ZQY0_ENSVE|nr:hypothetical protein B296_00002605 [Ensete ventricosum]